MASEKSSTTYHVINPTHNPIHDGLSGIADTYPARFCFAATTNTLYRADITSFRKDHVTIVAAAGGGHEPMFAGYVGVNGVSAFVSGAVFAAPTGLQMLAALRLCRSSRGNILVVGNYTGDVLNAGLAITRAKAEGINVKLLVVGDDVAVGRKKGGTVGRRGLCGHLIALKVICPMAEEGKDFGEIIEVAEWIVNRVGTIATAFDRCAVPSAIVTEQHLLPPDTVELGMGAHGEPGLMRLSPVPDPHILVQKMVRLLVDREDTDRGFVDLEKGRSVVLMVNNLGGTSDSVITNFAYLAISELENAGVKVERLLWGPLVTSLKMSGFGFAIGRIPNVQERGCPISNEKFLESWDSSTGTIAWPGSPSFTG